MKLSQYDLKLGYCEEARTYCSEAEERYKQGRADLLVKIRECAKHLGYEDIDDLLNYVEGKDQKNDKSV